MAFGTLDKFFKTGIFRRGRSQITFGGFKQGHFGANYLDSEFPEPGKAGNEYFFANIDSVYEFYLFWLGELCWKSLFCVAFMDSWLSHQEHKNFFRYDVISRGIWHKLLTQLNGGWEDTWLHSPRGCAQVTRQVAFRARRRTSHQIVGKVWA